MTKDCTFVGFGCEHTAEVWSQLLDIPFKLFKYYVENMGKTVEDIYAWYGRVYYPPKPKERKTRTGHQMEKTRGRMYDMLFISGYVGVNDKKEDVEVTPVDKNGNHRVSYKGSVVGVFNYKLGGIKLSGGEGIPLHDLDWEDAKVVKRPDGMWAVHPHTKKIIVESLRSKNI